MGASFALASGSAAAKEYAIEIIVFDRPAEKAPVENAAAENATAKKPADEQWDFSSERIAEHLKKMAALADKASEYETADEVTHLERVRLNLIESGYRILNTTRWRQPTSLYQNAPLIPLGDPETALAAGFVRIYTTSLIYADLHLQLSPPLPETETENLILYDLDPEPDAGAAPQQPHYFITEKRRLQFKQIHYFDHPLFGAILGLWEVDPETGN